MLKKGKIKILILVYIILFLYFNSKLTYGYTILPNDVNAISACLMDYDSGRILWEKNKDEKRSNASTTKILTCILALENSELNEKVKVSKYASSMPETKLGIREGEEYVMEDLLYALMLKSANDVAVAIAEHISGNVEDFAKLMNLKAKELGALNSNFVTPNGLDPKDVSHYSTAYDLALIMRCALKNEMFRKITSALHKEIMSSSGRRFYLSNSNKLLTQLDGIISGKTGYTDLAGHCFVGAMQNDDSILISVVLASGWGSNGKEAKWTDSKKILLYGKENFEKQTIICEGDVIARNVKLNSYNDETYTNLIANENYEFLLNKDGNEDVKIKLEIDVNNIKNILKTTDINKKDMLCNADIYYDNVKYSTIELCSSCTVKHISFSNSINFFIKAIQYYFFNTLHNFKYVNKIN